MRLSRARLDPIETVRELRGYLEPVDTDAPIEQMTRPYIVSGLVTIVDDRAYVSKLCGRLTREMIADFHRQMRDLGVTMVTWQQIDKGTQVMERVQREITDQEV